MWPLPQTVNIYFPQEVSHLRTAITCVTVIQFFNHFLISENLERPHSDAMIMFDPQIWYLLIFGKRPWVHKIVWSTCGCRLVHVYIVLTHTHILFQVTAKCTCGTCLLETACIPSPMRVVLQARGWPSLPTASTLLVALTVEWWTCMRVSSAWEVASPNPSGQSLISPPR